MISSSRCTLLRQGDSTGRGIFLVHAARHLTKRHEVGMIFRQIFLSGLQAFQGLGDSSVASAHAALSCCSFITCLTSVDEKRVIANTAPMRQPSARKNAPTTSEVPRQDVQASRMLRSISSPPPSNSRGTCLLRADGRAHLLASGKRH